MYRQLPSTLEGRALIKLLHKIAHKDTDDIDIGVPEAKVVVTGDDVFVGQHLGHRRQSHAGSR